MQIFNQTDKTVQLVLLDEIPQSLFFAHDNKSQATFCDGVIDSLACIHCKNPRCRKFLKEEILCEAISNFPADLNDEVCPVGAIQWDKNTCTPSIDNNKCIKCGVCVDRCPVGAIYFKGNAIYVNENLSGKEKFVEATLDNIQRQNCQIEKLKQVRRNGIYLKESDDLMCGIYQKLFRTEHSIHNRIIRNLLIAMGCHCAISRIGDVYTRMDAIYLAQDKSFGALEVEFGSDTLDAARGILDDIAVLHSRYGINKNENDPFVICLQLPNARQGYWQVVKDIKTVEGIIVNTVSVGALMVLNWNIIDLTPHSVRYYLDYDNMTLRAIISQHIGREVELSNKILGILEPKK